MRSCKAAYFTVIKALQSLVFVAIVANVMYSANFGDALLKFFRRVFAFWKRFKSSIEIHLKHYFNVFQMRFNDFNWNTFLHGRKLWMCKVQNFALGISRIFDWVKVWKQNIVSCTYNSTFFCLFPTPSLRLLTMSMPLFSKSHFRWKPWKTLSKGYFVCN